MATDEEPSSDFRERLKAIPKIEKKPTRDDWSNATPPVVRPSAPVARPAPDPRDHPQIAPRNPQPAIQQQAEHVGRSQGSTGDVRSDVVDPPRRKRRRWPIVIFAMMALAALVIIVPLFLANRTFNSVERVEFGDALVEAVPEGTNILLVGTDSRSGIDTETENSEVILGEGIAGERTDTILILRLEEDGSKFLSLPRDLWLPIDGGAPQRINAAFARGPQALVNTIQLELGVPISHYAEVDLAGFIDLVDAVGGVEIDVPNPAFDRGSGLELPAAGLVTLDSAQALAYVRSRTYTEIIDGVEVVDGTSDLGRVQRQQIFLRALLLKVGQERNPVTLNEMTQAIAQALVIDDGTSLTAALDLANTLRTSAPQSVTLPTSPTTTSGGAAVLTLTEQAPGVLAQFGG